jgi:hypothetical protein
MEGYVVGLDDSLHDGTPFQSRGKEKAGTVIRRLVPPP